MSDEEVWMRAWTASASCFNARLPDISRYADTCLKEFKARFPQTGQARPVVLVTLAEWDNLSPEKRQEISGSVSFT